MFINSWILIQTTTKLPAKYVVKALKQTIYVWHRPFMILPLPMCMTFYDLNRETEKKSKEKSAIPFSLYSSTTLNCLSFFTWFICVYELMLLLCLVLNNNKRLEFSRFEIVVIHGRLLLLSAQCRNSKLVAGNFRKWQTSQKVSDFQ